ncbi:trans-sialidase, putative, partial [Trypanosoma cruzi marinkellei]
MSRRVFTSAVLLLLFVVMCCGIGGAAHGDKTASGQRSSPKPYFDWRDKNEVGETVSSLHVPSLVEVNDNVFAVAEAQCTTKDASGLTGIASELLTWTDGKTKDLDLSKLKIQAPDECHLKDGQCTYKKTEGADSQSNTKVYVSRPTTVVHGNAIYMLAGNYSSEGTAAAVKPTDAVQWGLLLVRGNVSEENVGKRICWRDTYGLPWGLFSKQESLTRIIGSGGSGVKLKDGPFVFPVEGTKKENNKTVSLIIYSSATESWKLSKGMSADGCSDPSVVEWNDGKLMMMTACDDGRRRVYESGDKGESWTEALGTLSRVWGKKKDGEAKNVGSGFITATIDGDGTENRNVMLVLCPVYSTENG